MEPENGGEGVPATINEQDESGASDDSVVEEDDESNEEVAEEERGELSADGESDAILDPLGLDAVTPAFSDAVDDGIPSEKITLGKDFVGDGDAEEGHRSGNQGSAVDGDSAALEQEDFAAEPWEKTYDIGTADKDASIALTTLSTDATPDVQGEDEKAEARPQGINPLSLAQRITGRSTPPSPDDDQTTLTEESASDAWTDDETNGSGTEYQQVLTKPLSLAQQITGRSTPPPAPTNRLAVDEDKWMESDLENYSESDSQLIARLYAQWNRL